jgi:hypothetical protein
LASIEEASDQRERERSHIVVCNPIIVSLLFWDPVRKDGWMER